MAALSLLCSLALLAVLSCVSAPSVDAASTTRAAPTVVSTAGGSVNINTADVKELMTLDGIGKKVAEKIVEYRSANGPFKTPEEIRKVKGVGGGVWEKNRDRILVR